MQFGGVSIPNSLLDGAFSGSLVIFAGAGVSIPSPVELPTFDNLVNQIKDNVDPGDYLRGRNLKLGKEEDLIYTETPEQYLGFLESRGRNVKKACSALVNPHGKYTDLHANILTVFGESNPPRVVTTNFDNCFENAMDALGCQCKIYSSPALPLGKSFSGLVHLHGVYSDSSSIVLTAEDYGKAYVSNGWSSRFLVDLFKTYQVLFVGYSCGDSLVDYLTRSIYAEISGRSFALCKKSEADNWRIRGVEPLLFEEYDTLPKIFHDWSAYSKSSVTDKVLQIHNICQSDSMDQAEEEFIVSALRFHDEDDRYLFTSEFCKAANSTAHLQLLKKNGFLGFLSSKEPKREEMLLLDWLVRGFSSNADGALQSLCAEYIRVLSPIFFERLFWALATSGAPESATGSWLPWLESSDYLSQRRCEHQLIEIARDSQSDSIVLSALRILLKVYVAYPHPTFGEATAKASTVVSPEYYKDEIVEVIKARPANIGKQLFEYCYSQIEQAYRIQTKCWTDSKGFDRLSFGRSSIEPHSQDGYCTNAEGILIDVARESINENFYAEAQQKCLTSKCSLLVRLGLWIKWKYDCSEKDLDLIAERGLLSDCHIHHELFMLMRESFHVAPDENRNRFIEYLSSRVTEGDPHSEYYCYNICNWLISSGENCLALTSLRDSILKRNPNFTPREHPEFTHYTSSGFVNNDDECRIPVEEFTNDSLLALMGASNSPWSWVTKQERVSVPARDYPMIAVANLYDLLDKICSAEEIELMNLLITSIEWTNIDKSQIDVVGLFERLVSDKRTCIAGINALSSTMINEDNLLGLSCEELISLSEKALPNFYIMLSSESAVIKGEDPEWLTMGINHPAGKYIELLAQTERLYYEKKEAHCHRIALCFENACQHLSSESDAAKCTIACIFSQINTLHDLSPDFFGIKLLPALYPGNWAFPPAWEGLSYVGRLTPNAWSSTRGAWPHLFKNHSLVGKIQFEQLVRLYVWVILVLAKPKERALLLITCASASDDALRSACFQLNRWIGALDAAGRLNAWGEWIAEAFGKLAETMDKGPDILAEFYGRWIHRYPEMRNGLASAIERDCKEVSGSVLHVPEGTFTSIAEDKLLDPNSKAKLIIFLLQHQKCSYFEEDIIRAIQLMSQKQLNDECSQSLKDAATRRGLIDAACCLGGNEANRHTE